MIKQLATRVLDKIASYLLRVPPIYARMQRQMTANPQAFHQILNEDKVFSRIKAQKAFLDRIATDEKTLKMMLSSDSALETFFKSRTAPSMVRDWLNAREGEKAPPFFKAVVLAALDDPELLDTLLDSQSFLDRVAAAVESLPANEAAAQAEAEAALTPFQRLVQKAEGRVEDDAAEAESAPPVDPVLTKRALKLLATIAEKAPNRYLGQFVLGNDDLLATVLTSPNAVDEVLRHSAEYLADVAFTGEHRQSLYAVIAALVRAKPAEFVKEFFNEPISEIARDPLVRDKVVETMVSLQRPQIYAMMDAAFDAKPDAVRKEYISERLARLSLDADANAKFMDFIVGSHRPMLYDAFDTALKSKPGQVQSEYLDMRLEQLLSGSLKKNVTEYVLANLGEQAASVKDNRKLLLFNQLFPGLRPASVLWVIEDLIKYHPQAAQQMARVPEVVRSFAGADWSGVLHLAQSDEAGLSLGDLFRLTANTAPDTFLKDFIATRPDWAAYAAINPAIKQAVLSNLGEGDAAVLKSDVLRPASLLRQLAMQSDEGVRQEVLKTAKLAADLVHLKPYVPEAEWEKGVKASATAKVPGIEAFWAGIETNGVVPFEGGGFRIPSRADMATITDEILLREEYFLSEYGPEDSPYIIDCGTNIGLSIVYLKTLFPKATVLGFEPVTHIREIAQANMVSLGLDRVTIMPNAIAGEAGRRRLRVSLDNTLAGSITDRMDRKNGHTLEETVDALPLSDFIKGPVDFIKMDIEGVEHEVLVNIKDKLPLVRYLFCEFHYDGVRSRRKLEETLAMLGDAGFLYHIARTPWAEARFAHRPLSHVGQSYSVSIYARNPVWPPVAAINSAK